MKTLNVVCLVVLCLTFATMAADTGPAERFAERYRKATSESDKRNICIEAIDKGLIRRGVQLSVVERLFGNDFSKNVGTDPKGLTYGLVDFVAPRKSASDDPGFITGWYMVVSYDAAGLIVSYHLTNLHK